MLWLMLTATFQDGSFLKVQVSDHCTLTVNTKYGTQHVPMKDIQSIALGIHVEKPQLFREAALNLGNKNWITRDAAFKFLANDKRCAYPYLAPLADHEDLEVKTRALQLLNKYGEKFPVINDKIYLRSCEEGSGRRLNIVGRIDHMSIPATSSNFGNIRLYLHQLKSLDGHQ